MAKKSKFKVGDKVFFRPRHFRHFPVQGKNHR